MKKIVIIVFAIILVIAICASVGFYAYHNHKSNDNLPALTAIAEMSESDVNNILSGYKIDQLREVWGEPNYSEESSDSWQTGDITLVVNYKNNGTVAICGLKYKNGTSVGEK